MDSITNLTGRMHLHNSLSELQANAAERVGAARSLEELAAIEVETVGKRSPVAEARRALGDMPAADRREEGRFINELAAAISTLVDERRAVLEDEAESARLSAEMVDVTLPGRVPARGTHHLIRVDRHYSEPDLRTRFLHNGGGCGRDRHCPG